MVFGMIICMLLIAAAMIFAILKIQSKALAVIVAVLISCVVMMPFSCCAKKWHENYKTEQQAKKKLEKEMKKQLKEQKKAEKELQKHSEATNN